MIAEDTEGFLKYLENVTFQLACLLDVDGNRSQVGPTKKSLARQQSSLPIGKKPRSGKPRQSASASTVARPSEAKRTTDNENPERISRSMSKKFKSKRKSRSQHQDAFAHSIDLLNGLSVTTDPSSSLVNSQAATSTDLLLDIESKPQLSGHIDQSVHIAPASSGVAGVPLSDLTPGAHSIIVNDGVSQLGIISDHELAPLDPHGSSISPLETTLAQFHSTINQHQQNQHAHQQYFAISRGHLDSYAQIQDEFSTQDTLQLNGLGQQPVSPSQLHSNQDNSRSGTCNRSQQQQQQQARSDQQQHQQSGSTSSSRQGCYLDQQLMQSAANQNQRLGQLHHPCNQNQPRQHQPLMIHMNHQPAPTNQLGQHTSLANSTVSVGSNNGSLEALSSINTIHEQSNHCPHQLDQQWLSTTMLTHITDTPLLGPSDPNSLEHVVPLSPATHQSLEQVQFSAPLYPHQSYYASHNDQLDSFQQIPTSDDFTSSSSSPINSHHHDSRNILVQLDQQALSIEHQRERHQNNRQQMGSSEVTNSGGTYDSHSQQRNHDHHHIQPHQAHIQDHHHHQLHQHQQHQHQQMQYMSHNNHLHHQQINLQQIHSHNHHHHHHQLAHHSQQMMPVIGGLEPVSGVILQDINLASATWSSPEDLYSM